MHQRDKVTLMPSLLLMQRGAREGKDEETGVNGGWEGLGLSPYLDVEM